jgi:outer membrane protein assembly factor BamB
MRAILRSFLSVAVVLTLVGCTHRAPVTPRPLFPMTATWTRPVPATVEGPLAADAISVFVATRDGAVRALDVATGRPRWRVDDRPGVVAAGGGLVAVRNEDGTVWTMDSATGADRWKAASGVRGPLPAVLYKDAVVVAGEGLVVLEASTGQPRWSVPEARATAAPMGWGAWLFVGEEDGSLRCRDLATGAVLWSYKTAHPLVAPPVVDDEGHVLLGTTDRRFVALDSRKKGHVRWSWKIGGDVQAMPAVSGQHVLFTNHEDVLYALRRGNGHLAWRASLPSRPLSGPILYGDSVLVACFGSRPGETFLIGFDPRTGQRQGDLKAPGEVRTPPVIVGDTIVMALRDRAVAALRLGSLEPNP